MSEQKTTRRTSRSESFVRGYVSARSDAARLVEDADPSKSTNDLAAEIRGLAPCPGHKPKESP